MSLCTTACAISSIIPALIKLFPLYISLLNETRPHETRRSCLSRKDSEFDTLIFWIIALTVAPYTQKIHGHNSPLYSPVSESFCVLGFFFSSSFFYNQFHWRDVTDPEPHAYIYAPFKSAQRADAALIFLDSDVLPPFFFFFPALPGSLFKEVNQMPWKNIGNDSCHRDVLICDSDSNYKERRTTSCRGTSQRQFTTHALPILWNTTKNVIKNASLAAWITAPIRGYDACCCHKCLRKRERRKQARKGHSVQIIYDNRWMAGALARWANTTSAPCASHCATADGVCVTLGKNPLCQNSFPAREN